MNIDETAKEVLDIINGEEFKEEGAYNVRYNGQALCHGDTEHVKIKKKEDKQGIDVFISSEAQGERLNIPVVVSVSGMTDEVYNDFFVEAGADVTIVAGCGIHNSGCNDTRHDGIHTFHIGKGANVRYEEKHYGAGEGTGGRILNPVTKIILEEEAVFTLDTVQIKGVDSTVRKTEVILGKGSKLFATEKLMTHDKQSAESDMDVILEGEDSSAQIISRSVADGESRQVFHPRAVGENMCHAHIQCDSIIMGQAQVASIPEIDAKHIDAAIIHEAAIGRINNEQLLKLRTFGMTEEEAEAVIIEAFLN
ncbi:MAG: SufD family Fe-S cluster assembly protein [Lachnospiraceae bacterium]|nr:SufD family Fe-S cluster assembly protein [Lachnospiraceae bacterium]